VQQGFTLASLTAPHVTLLDDAGDDIRGLHIPFQAGDTFVLGYGEHPFPQGYSPLSPELPNGSRWQGVVVVPEPRAVAVGLMGIAAALRCVYRGAPRISRRTSRSD
jgi:hypothetical protein